MQLVERTIIKQNHPTYKSLDNLAFLSKNLYNIANYIVRQEFINNGNYLNYNKVQKLLQNQVDYQAIPAKVSQQVLILLDKNWQSFFRANTAYNECPDQFKASPKLPKYKHKTKGRNILVYTRQAISKPKLVKNKQILLSKSNLLFPTKINYDSLQQVRIIPKVNYYVIEVVYEAQQVKLYLSENQVASVDLGVNNLATVTSNKKGFQPVIINGRQVKSINQFYNQKKAKLQSLLKATKSSNRIQRLSRKRNLKIDDYLHKASRYIINHLIENKIGTLVIGNNPNWKQGINLGKKRRDPAPPTGARERSPRQPEAGIRQGRALKACLKVGLVRIVSARALIRLLTQLSRFLTQLGIKPHLIKTPCRPASVTLIAKIS